MAEAGGAPSRRARLAVAGGFGLLVFAALAWLARAQGITWDEARDYLLWVRRFDAWVDAVLAEGAAAWTRERIDAGVASDDRHPHLFKLMGWLSASLLPDALPFPLRARLGPAAFVAATLAFALHHLLGRYGWLPAAAALLAVVGQPRFLGHGSFLATDAPLACFVLLGVLACADAERSPRARALLYVAVAGAIWTKFTGVGLPVVLGLGCLLRGRPRLLVHLALASALGLGLLALTFPPWRLAAFFGQAVEHGYSRPFSVYFLGEWYAGRPPWTWLPVMLAVVPPVGVALTMGGGTLALALRTVRARDPLAIQLLVACAAFGALFLLPFVPRHDGIRQALYLFVLLGVAGGLGLGLAAQSWLARTKATLPRALLVAAALLLPASGLVVAWRERPLLLSTFSEAVGGLHGAYYRLRLEPTYWADAVTPAVLAELNALLPPGATLAMPFPGEYPFRLRRLGLLRSDVVPSLDGEYLLLLNRTSLMPVARRRIEHAQELQRWERHGVPLLILYRVGKPREPGR
jgi:hypothetical protein